MPPNPLAKHCEIKLLKRIFGPAPLLNLGYVSPLSLRFLDTGDFRIQLSIVSECNNNDALFLTVLYIVSQYFISCVSICG